jgi:hypothetical protein
MKIRNWLFVKAVIIIVATSQVLTAQTGKEASAIPSIVLPQDYQAERASSNDPTGGNRDHRTIAPGETLPLADLQGPGIIRHIWITIGSEDPEYLSNLILQIRWDGCDEPAVDAPIGPFFTLGHDEVADVVSAPIAVMTGKAFYINHPPGRGALNCYFAMPFHKRARIKVINRGNHRVTQFFYQIDWQRHDQLPAKTRYFHARYNSEETQTGTKPDGKNPKGEENYIILDTPGRGHYVGCSLHVEAHQSEAGKWYEGDDMIVVDNEPVQKGILGTGTEDYFGLSWGVRRIYQAPYFGSSFVEWNEGEPEGLHFGRFSVYRWHLPDPIPFDKSIKVSIEHGHNNDAANSYASVAYWYATKP